ncbi:MAG: thioredoxin family protein [Bernardetiaceae bacterium]
MLHHRIILLLLLSLVLSFSDLHAEGETGIAFDKTSWEQVQQRAKAENKHIFVDAFAVWCGPCKWMDKNVFAKEEVGKYFNEHFISFKFDMEKGDGPSFARTYEVKAYPTFLFFDPNGNLVHRTVGGRAPEDFLQVGAAALSPDTQSETLRMRYQKGDRDPNFLYNYVLMLNSTMEYSDDALAAYLDTQKEEDLTNARNWKLIREAGQGIHLDIFDFVVKNQKKYADAFGEAEVMDYLMGAFKMELSQAVRSQNEERLQAVQKRVSQAVPEPIAKSFSTYADFLFRSRDPIAAFPYAVAYFDAYANDPDELNSIAWFYYQNSQDAQILEKSLSWAQKSIKITPKFANTDTAAHLLYALGKYDEAIQTAEQAIALGKADGEDISSTQALIEASKEKKK